MLLHSRKKFVFKLFLELGVLFLALLCAYLILDNYLPLFIFIILAFLTWNYVMGLKLINAIFNDVVFNSRTFGIWNIIKDEYNYWFIKERNKQKELLQILARTKKGMNKIKQGILIGKTSHEIIWANKAAGRILQFDYKNKVKQNFLHLNHDIEVRNFVVKLATGNKDKASITLQNNQNHYKIRGYRIDNIYLLLIENITLAQLEKLRQSHLISYINHDLRTPLTVLSGYLEMLEAQPNLLPKALDSMQKQVVKIQYLIEELSQLSQLTNKDIDKNAWCNFSEQIESIAKDVGKLHPNYPLSLAVEKDVYINGAKLNLNRLATNLIYNAIKHNPQNTPINIILEKFKEGIKFSVEDKGIGIDKEHIPYLTVRLYKVDKARGTDNKQSGLGLSIVKHILENYGSKLEIESTKFQGSTFSFYIKGKYVQFELPATKTAAEQNAKETENLQP